MKEKLKRSPLYPLYRAAQSQLAYAAWAIGDKTEPPPHRVKWLAVKKFAREHHLSTLVETGTYLGDMVTAVKNNFSCVWSIEIEPALYEKARQKFAGIRHITVLLGDSGEVLKDLVPQLDEGTLFWLDAHFSGGVTGRGALDSPILQELVTIFDARLERMAILIDDARLFVGAGGYPTMQELRQLVSQHKPGWTCEVVHDIIRIYPAVV